MSVKTILLVAALVACNNHDRPQQGSAAPHPSGPVSRFPGSASPATPPPARPAPASSAPAAGGDPCANVGDAVRSIWDRQVADAKDDATKQAARQMGDKAVARLQKHCRADGWSPDVIDCVRHGGVTCTGKMTPAQVQALNADQLQ